MDSDNTRPDPAFPASHAFVVQLRKEAEHTTARLAGVIEHVISGQTKTFASVTELAAFILQVLEQEEDEKSP